MLAAGLVVALGGCGFHLEGAARLPTAFRTTSIRAADRYTAFHEALVAALGVAGATVVGAGESPRAVVEILADEPTQRVLSVSASNTPTEYEVYYAIRYRVLVDGQEMIAPIRLELTRSYSFDPRALLAKEREQEIIKAALAHELASLVMHRIAALGS